MASRSASNVLDAETLSERGNAPPSSTGPVTCKERAIPLKVESEPTSIVSSQHAEGGLQCKAAEPQRHTLLRHLRDRHMRPPIGLWVNLCRWCGLESWWHVIKEPADRLSVYDLQLRVRKLEERADQFDGDRDA